MEFDPELINTLQSFLAKHDPGSTYTFEKCSGGIINLTLRAFRNPGSETRNSPFGLSSPGNPDQDLRTLIIKYAPPYAFAVGPELPFSADRQRIEAAALSLLNDPHFHLNGNGNGNGISSSSSASPSQTNSVISNYRNYSDDNILVLCEAVDDYSNNTGNSVCGSMAVSIPKLYHFSEKDHFLVIEDLGKLRALEEWLQLPHNLDRVRDVGIRLGTFLAGLHSTDVGRFLSPHSQQIFKSRIGHELVEKCIVTPLIDYLNLFRIEGQLGRRVYEIVAENHRLNAIRKEQAELDTVVFSNGDFWPPSILLGDDDKELRTKVAVVDWEFAGYASPMQDMVQLAAHLHLALLSACGDVMRKKVETLLEAMRNAYHEACVSTSSKWVKSVNYLNEDSGGKHAKWIRDAWILHGREMINNAAEREWEGCVPLDRGPSVWSECPLRRRMVEVGSWYVDVAGKSVEEMLMRWNEVENELVLRGFYLGSA